MEIIRVVVVGGVGSTGLNFRLIYINSAFNVRTESN